VGGVKTNEELKTCSLPCKSKNFSNFRNLNKMEGPFSKQIRLYLKEILPRELTENAWEKI